MEYHTAQLMREPTGSQRTYRVDEPELEGAAGPIVGELTLLRTDAGVLVQAALRTSVATTCSRCLAPTHTPVDLVVEEEYYPTVDVDSGTALPALDGETLFLIDEHHILDIREAVRQQLVLAEPMKPLCRDDCAGLCPTCGLDLNAGRCKCPTPDTDPRWAALHELIQLSETAESRSAGE